MRQTLFRKRDEALLERCFMVEIELRRRAPECAKDILRVFRRAELTQKHIAGSRNWSGDEQHSVAGLLEFRWDGAGNVVENADDAEHRRGIDAFAACLVIEAHVAAGDGSSQCVAGLGNAVNGGRELRHDLWLLRITEVEAICSSHWHRSRAGDFARAFCDRVHGAKPGVEIRPSAIPIEGHSQSALMSRCTRLLDAHDAGFVPRTLHCVGLHHGVVLLVNPALAADVGGSEQRLQCLGMIFAGADLGSYVRGRIERDGSLPCADGPVIERRIVSEGGVGNIGDEYAVMADLQAVLADDMADDDAVQSPLFKDAEDLLFAALCGYQQHALLALAQHDLVGGHAGSALGNEVEFDIETDAATRAHFTGGAGEPGRAHILNADDCASAHRLQAGFQQQLLHERIADLDVGPLLLGAFLELLAGHGGAVDAVAPCLSSYIYNGVADAAGFSVEDFFAPHHAERESVDQGIAVVTALELGLAAQVGYAEAVAVGGDAADHTLSNGVILADEFVGRVVVLFSRDGSKAQRIHYSERARAHGENIAQNAAYTSGRTLKGFDVGRMIVRLNLECAGPAIAYINDAGVLARSLHDEGAPGGEPLEMNARGFIGAMLAPHNAVNAEFS